MSAASDFYTDAHLGNRFGIKGPAYGPHGHLGVDFNKMPPGTSIPAWRAGHVVERGYSTNLGYYLIVKTDIGYVGYHHMQSQAFAPPGEDITFGQIIGRLGYTGLLVEPSGPRGTHLHTTLADSSLVGGQDVHDPLPYIRGTITAAGGNTRPIGGDSTDDTTTPEVPKEDDDMKDHMLLEHTNADGSTQWLLVSPDLDHAVDVWKVDTANAFSRRIAMAFNGGLRVDATPLEGAILTVSAAEFNGFRAAANLPPLQTPVTDKV